MPGIKISERPEVAIASDTADVLLQDASLGVGIAQNVRIKLNTAIRNIAQNEIILGPYASITALKSIDTTSINDGVLSVVIADNSIFKLHKTGAYATALGDDNVVIEPTTGAGRWIRENEERALILTGGSSYIGTYNASLPMATYYLVDPSLESGGIFVFPNATTLREGTSIVIRNQGESGDISVRLNADVVTSYTIRPKDVVKFTLIQNNTVQGLWEGVLLQSSNLLSIGNLDGQNGILIQTEPATFKKNTIKAVDVSVGNSYTPILSDWADRLVINSPNNVLFNLDQAGQTLPVGYYFDVENLGIARIHFTTQGTLVGLNFLQGQANASCRVTLIGAEKWEVSPTNVELANNLALGDGVINLGINNYNRRNTHNSADTLLLNIVPDSGGAESDLPIGFYAEFYQLGTGIIDLEYSPTINLILNGADHTTGPGDSLFILKTAVNTYLVQSRRASDNKGVQELSADYTLLPTDLGKIFYKTNSVNISITPGAVATFAEGAQFTFVNTSSSVGFLRFDPAGSETVNGYSTYDVNPGQTITVAVVGDNWRIVSGHLDPFQHESSAGFTVDPANASVYRNNVVRLNGSALQNMIINDNLSLRAGDRLYILQSGIGNVQITAGANATILSPYTVVGPWYTIGRYAMVMLYCEEPGMFTIHGDYQLNQS